MLTKIIAVSHKTSLPFSLDRTFEETLSKIEEQNRKSKPPQTYICYAWGKKKQEHWVELLNRCLVMA